MQIKLIVFILCTIVLAIVSLRNFRKLEFRGIFRFLAWELILALFLINMDFWFNQKFSIHQVFSWGFLFISFYLLADSTLLMIMEGKPRPNRPDAALFGFEKTTHLVTSRIYHYIRHPMYSSLLFLAWGLFLKGISWIAFILAVASTLSIIASSLLEEKEDIQYFGQKYLEYMKRTKRYIPFMI